MGKGKGSLLDTNNEIRAYMSTYTRYIYTSTLVLLSRPPLLRRAALKYLRHGTVTVIAVGKSAFPPSFRSSFFRSLPAAMGFLKSLSRSIKRAAPQHPDDHVSECETVQPSPSPLASSDIQVETAGVRRPSGQGAIARRDRRRSSEKGLAVETGTDPSGVSYASVSTLDSDDHVACRRQLTCRLPPA